MQELSLQEIQEIELRLLVQFDNICKKKTFEIFTEFRHAAWGGATWRVYTMG